MLSRNKMMLGVTVALVLFATKGIAQPIIVDPENGQYLGNLNKNKYDPNSVSNPYGLYGSPYSPNSINNPYGQYGSPYSPKSANNPYATQSPIIIDPNNPYDNGRPYNRYGR